MSDITIINDSQQSELVTNGLAKNGELYLKAAGSTDEGAVVVYDSGSWRTFANEFTGGYSNDNSLSFDGTDDYLTTSSTVTMGSSTFSFSWWNKKPGSLPNGSHFFGFGSSGSTLFRAMAWGDSVRAVMGPSPAYTGINHSNWQSGWNHIVYTMDGATHTLYWNGSQLAQVTSAPTFSSGTDTFEVARAPQFSTAYQQIFVDEFSMFNATLSSSDVTALYNSGVPNDLNDSSSYNTDRTNNLVAWWRMGETDSGAGTTITNAASGTASGGSSFDLSFGGAPSFSTDVPS